MNRALLSLLAVLLVPTDVAPESKPPWCSPDPVPAGSTSWPNVFAAVGELQQMDCNQPGCVNRHPGLGYCSALGSIQYNWDRRAMITEYSPCLPLITPNSGSAGACSYHFIGGNLYYIYRDQDMVHGTQPVPEPRCCKISDFPMLSPSFPLYVEQYARRCKGHEPRDTRMYAQIMRWLATPGNPPGFYGFYPQVTRLSESPGIALRSWAMPYGFGGGTPGSFSQISYRDFDPQPRSQPSYEVPALCLTAPECTTRNLEKPSMVITVSAFLQCLKPVRAGACALCHTTQTEPVWSGEFPCCPNELWQQGACVPAAPEKLPPETVSCLQNLPGLPPAAETSSAPGLLAGH